MKPFTLEQKQAMERGAELANKLEHKAMEAFKCVSTRHRAKRHHYIVGRPGIGKSFTITMVAKRHKIRVIPIVGVSSLNAMLLQLAFAAYKAKGEDLFVWIDDCDSVFQDKETLSVMKGALDEDRAVFSWNKNITTQIHSLEKSEHKHDQWVAEALRHFQTPDGVGIEIPTKNINFIVTSNHALASSNPLPKGAKKINEAALRDRVSYTEFETDDATSWGWATFVTMKSRQLFGLTREQKRDLVEYIHINWKHMPSTSLRTIKEMAAEMANYPRNYLDHWKLHLKK